MYWLLASFLAGLVSACGFAPLELWPLTLAALAVLLYGSETAPRLRTALARGWWFGFGQFVLGLNWIATAFTYQSNMPAWLGWVAVAVLSLYLAIYPAMAAGLAWRWGRSDRLRLVLVFAAAWIVTEYLRGVLFTGFPWNPLGVSLVPTPVASLATVTGTYGLAGIVAVIAGAVFLLARREWRPAISVAAIVVAATLAMQPWGAAEETGGASVRIVQPGVSQAEKHGIGYEDLIRQRLGDLTTRPRETPQLVLWPEDAMPYILDEAPRARRLIGEMLGPRDLLLTGAAKIEYGGDSWAQGARNSTYLMDAAGRLRGRYDKAHLVPYGEYLPMRPLLEAIGLSRVVPGDLDFWEGPGPQTLDLPGFGRAGIQICYEIVFSGQVVDRANRPDFIFNPSNDAWFGWWGPPQHFAQARLRAVEEGLPVLRSTPTGISGIIDHRGRVVATLPPGEAEALDAALPAPGSPTLFSRAGNLMPFALALLLVAAALLHARLQSRAKRAREQRT